MDEEQEVNETTEETQDETEQETAPEEQVDESVDEDGDGQYDELSARIDALEETVANALDMIATLSIGEEHVDDEPTGDEYDNEYGDAVDLDELDQVLGK